MVNMIDGSLSSYLEGFERYTPESVGGGLDMDNAGYQDEDRRHTPSGECNIFKSFLQNSKVEMWM